MLKKIETINKKIKKLSEQVKQIQNECVHPEDKLKRGKFCNDPWQISYYKTFHCQDCNKYWTEMKD